MNRRVVFYHVGRLLQIEAALLLLPLLVSVIYREKSFYSFIITAAVTWLVGFLFTKLCRKKDSTTLYVREGFAIVALAWVMMSLAGALPFFISGEIPSYVDSFFETVSGFTTTGASILPNVEALSKGMLFWRSFTHWVGGMGVLVFVMAIFPQESGRSIHIMRAEMPGPIVGKLVPKIKDTAKILYLIYIVITFIQIIFLVAGRMPLFDSVIHSFGTAGTGGFGIKADSIAGYSPYLQWVITIFMLIFGINFNLFYLLIIRRFKSVLKSTELWCYIAIVVVSTAAISINIYSSYSGIAETVRTAAFQVSSIITTTGYATTDFNLWPGFSKMILVTLMFIGGCAGSTAGGFKLSRVIILFKSTFRDLRQTMRPRSVSSVKLEGKTLDKQTIEGVRGYLAIYTIIFFILAALLSIENLDFETTMTSVVATFNNVGPGLGGVGPASSFASFSDPAKILLSIAMLLGRLEIYPLLLAFSPALWRKK
ncbi:MAG: TrkH family potassium uptake protein [Clostridia bacterium]|nr:TrkH family potassium uptake protein [Clostridia bacterium]